MKELSQRETPNSWIYLSPECDIMKQSQESNPWGRIPAEQSQESNPSRAQSKGEQSNREKPHESNPWRAIPGWSPWVHLGCLWEAPVALQNLENRALDSDDQKAPRFFTTRAGGRIFAAAVEYFPAFWEAFGIFWKPFVVGAAALAPFGNP